MELLCCYRCFLYEQAAVGIRADQPFSYDKGLPCSAYRNYKSMSIQLQLQTKLLLS